MLTTQEALASKLCASGKNLNLDPGPLLASDPPTHHGGRRFILAGPLLDALSGEEGRVKSKRAHGHGNDGEGRGRGGCGLRIARAPHRARGNVRAHRQNGPPCDPRASPDHRSEFEQGATPL
jgi:hypothetical protein